MSDFIFELYTEEIPAAYQQSAIRQWQQRLPGLLESNLLVCKRIECGGTARRIYIYLTDLQPGRLEKEEELKGPPEDLCFDGKNMATAAMKGFAAKAGVKVKDVRFKEIKNKSYAVALQKIGGGSAVETLLPLINGLITSTSFPKSMHWADSSLNYARPVVHYFARYGGKKIKPADKNCKFLGEIRQSDNILVHSSAVEKSLKLEDAKDYFKVLKFAGVLVKPDFRLDKIKGELKKTAAKNKLFLLENEDLLNEVNFLVESPVVICGKFPEDFLELPEVVILSEMNQHQKYFALVNSRKKLNNKFLIVADTGEKSTQTLNNIRSGNERVLIARLQDGSYFFSEDRKRPLIENSHKLKNLLFQEGLGSIYDKKERLKKISQVLLNLSDFPVPVQEGYIDRACDLLKADLVSHLVFEFEHLQGDIGRIYAGLDGEPDVICQAIYEHYQPRNQEDEHPSSALGTLLSLAEKIDNIIAGFLLGKQPTANTDPQGLRRQSLFLIQQIIDNKIHLNFDSLISKLLEIYPIENNKYIKNTRLGAVSDDIWDFTRVRLATIFEKQGFDKPLVRAGLYSGNTDIYNQFLKLSAMKDLQSDQEFKDLMSAFKRMSNIIADYKQKITSEQIPESVKPELFKTKEEKKLFEISENIRGKLEESMKYQKDYESIFKMLADSKPAVDLFFDNVLVMDKDEAIRDNRIALLYSVIQPLKQLLDLNQLK